MLKIYIISNILPQNNQLKTSYKIPIKDNIQIINNYRRVNNVQNIRKSRKYDSDTRTRILGSISSRILSIRVLFFSFKYIRGIRVRVCHVFTYIERIPNILYLPTCIIIN